MIKIIIPIAGSSDSFLSAGYIYPKPLIEINGLTMIQLVTQHVNLTQPYQIIYIIQNTDAIKYHLDNTLKLISPDCAIVKLKKGTKGALCSVLMAIDHISEDDSLLILNGDQIISDSFANILDFWNDKDADAGVVTFKSVHPRWSYAAVQNGQVGQTAEKNPISNHAIAGCYYFASAKTFFESAFQSILNDVQHEGNYYISPVMNQYVLKGKKILNYPIATDNYHSFYSPQLLEKFIKEQNDNTR